MITRFGQYIGAGRTLAPPATQPDRPPAPPVRTPTAIQLAGPVALRLQDLVQHAATHGPVDGISSQAQVIDRGLRELLAQLRHELGVGDQWPAPPRTRAPRGRAGGSATVQVTVKFDPSLLAEARAALWTLRQTHTPPHDIGSLNELVTVATDRLLRDLERRHHTGSPASRQP
jgi:hypothetical protein